MKFNILNSLTTLLLIRLSKSAKQKSNLSSFTKKSKNIINDNPFHYKPKSENQKNYVKFLEKDSCQMIVVSGPAGTGKTMFACIQAIKQLKEEKVNKIVLTRPIVSVEEEEIGFLPGNIQKKMDPWTKPVFDIFQEFYTIQEIHQLIHNNIIEISPLGFMRGRTFKNSFIIADEMQNSTPNQMLMLTTRIGDGSKIVITGDIQQKDSSHLKCGLSDLIERMEKHKKLNLIFLR